MIFANPVCRTELGGEQTPGILVSIVIPAYNEADNLGGVLAELHALFEHVRMDHEIIVVDDGSTDKTGEVASRNGVKVLSNMTNQGKGRSLRRGFECAKGEIIVMMDADGSHDPKDIERLILPVLNGADVAVGSRFNTSEGRKTTSSVKIFGNNMINLAIRLITGTAITDSQCGFRAYKSKVLKKTVLNSKGFRIETELTLKPILNGYSLQEIPIFVRNRRNGLSHVNPITDGFRIMTQIIRSATLSS